MKKSLSKKASQRRLADSRVVNAGWALISPVALWCQRHPRLRILAGASLFFAILGCFVLFGIFLHFDRIAAKFDLSRVTIMAAESTVYDVRGETIGYLHRDGQTAVPLGQVSEFFKDALLAREDKRFFKHGGVDYIGALRAGVRNTKDGEVVQGASTLTMQLARNTFGMRQRTVQRKMVEMALAKRIENKFSKEKILELYVNRIFFGSGLNGIEQAAQGYFNKPASALNLPEAALIAGIIRAPNRFSPYRHYEAALGQMRDTLDRMAAEKMISEAEANVAKETRPRIMPQSHARSVIFRQKPGPVISDSYPIEIVSRRLEEILTDEQKTEGGLEIYTTFDRTLQREAEQIVERHAFAIERMPDFSEPTYAQFMAEHAAEKSMPEPNYLQAAVSVIDNSSGAVRVLVGGRNFSHSSYNRATQARRQIGSILKPLVYATAFETGLFPGSLIDDGPIRHEELAWDTSGWDPRNADGRSLGLQPVSFGLVKSRNTMSVRIGERAGINAVRTMMDHAGIADSSDLKMSPQIYIGNHGASLNSMVSAYSVFANEGWRFDPYFIERIEDREGGLVFDRPKKQGRQVLSPGASWLTSNMLQRALENGGTGARVRDLGFNAPAGGKTGTTNDFRDAWFLGYTNKLTGGVWLGFDQPRTIVRGGYGGKLALPIWTEIMRSAEDNGYVFDVLPESDEIIEVELCRHSGHLADETCRHANCAYREQVPHAMMPRNICGLHQISGVIRARKISE